MSTFSQYRENLKRAFAGEWAQRDLLKVACAEAGAEYRVVHVPPEDAGTGAPDRDTVRRWPTEAYAGRPYQLRADDRPALRCPPGAIEQIAPGTDLSIRPFVLSDGGSARIQMKLTTNVAVDQPDANQLAKRDVPFDLIRSHSVTTEATISAFDLETISSFGVQTTAPGDYAWRSRYWILYK